MDIDETVWTEREFVGHDFRDDDLSRLRTERAVFDECDFRGVNLSESEHIGSAFRNCTFERATLHHSVFRQCSMLGSVFSNCRLRPVSLIEIWSSTVIKQLNDEQTDYLEKAAEASVASLDRDRRVSE